MNDKLGIKKNSVTSATSIPWWQKRKLTIVIVLLGLVAILILINMSIVKYEQHLATGNTVLLELAPVDPRGFMQGDYMALSYALEREIFDALQPEYDKFVQRADTLASENKVIKAEAFETEFRTYKPSDGYVIVRVDSNNVGHFVRLADKIERDNRNKLAANELPIYYRIRNSSVQLATNAFFFQEGHAESFETAKYGLFRVNEQGEPLLTEMVDEKFKVIEGTSNQGEEASK
ncbi:GDYXXLXY domain-containing protein [Psychrobacter frigidicola]|uniref:GDYXXLXY domain-containing protein n=1 Tax=Psychrobacter frigidicola TaxID=45611 RepID=A0A5C7A7R0_9GAMM|nr:GDYXXLXY domain-containing protein [Psychrobacter frigidicola]TXD96780.1 GDYXXLXY domain-containing protein [Psychrobacter frigidicola]